MKGKKKYAASTDVARLAGVSQSAVSRTFKPGASVSEETRRKVLDAAAQLDYRPSLIPRIMLTHQSNLVALVIGGMYNPFYATVLELFTIKLQETGHQVLLVHVDNDHALDAVIPKLASYRVDAIVSALAVLSTDTAARLAKLKIPVVSFNTPVTNKWVSSICCDNRSAARHAAELFLKRGARRFGYIAGHSDSPASLERLAGFRECLNEHGIGEIAVAQGNFHYEGGFNAAVEMFNQAKPPEAIFCANDLTALGAIDALRKKCGRKVPEDVLVAGFDDIPEASWAAYDLTTFIHDAPRMVEESLTILHASIASHSPVGELQIVVPAQFVERGTTRR